MKYILIFKHFSGWFLVWLSSKAQGARRHLRTVHLLPGNRRWKINVIHDWSMVHLKLSKGERSHFLFTRISRDQVFITFNFTQFHYLRNQTSHCLAPKLWQQEVLEPCTEARKGRALWTVLCLLLFSLPWQITTNKCKDGFAFVQFLWGGRRHHRSTRLLHSHSASVPRKQRD